MVTVPLTKSAMKHSCTSIHLPNRLRSFFCCCCWFFYGKNGACFVFVTPQQLEPWLIFLELIWDLKEKTLRREEVELDQMMRALDHRNGGSDIQ